MISYCLFLSCLIVGLRDFSSAAENSIFESTRKIGHQPGRNKTIPISWMHLRNESAGNLDDLRRSHSRREEQTNASRLNYEEIYDSKVDGIEITENDIIVNKSTPFYSDIENRNFLIQTRYHWPTTVIPFIIDPAAPYDKRERGLIMDAIAEYHKHTCLRFIRRTTQEDYIFITHDAIRGCSSNVGKQGGKQVMYLRIPGCVRLIGTAIHELLHNLGFFHEHSRPDRDSNIKIIWKDITPGYENNFDAYSPAIIDTLGQPYDYDSVMQYSAVAFSKDSTSLTIIPFHADPRRLGQRRKFSETDIKKVNLAYKCPPRKRFGFRDSTTASMEGNWTSMTPTVSGPMWTEIHPALCYSHNPIAGGVMDSNGSLIVSKNGYYWIYNETTPGKFSTNHLPGRTLPKEMDLIPPNVLDAVAFLDGHYYFFKNGVIHIISSMDEDAVFDSVPSERLFKPAAWPIKGVFQLENQYFLSNGSTLFLYNPVNDAILSAMTFPSESGLPPSHSTIFSIGNDRLMIISGSLVYITKPHQLMVETGFPKTFQAVFC